MSADFYLGRGDLLPTLTATLRDADGVVVDLTDADSVQFVMRARASTVVKIDAAAVVTEPLEGGVEYAWVEGDSDTAGAFEGRWIVTFPGALPLSFPNDEHLSIMISGA